MQYFFLQDIYPLILSRKYLLYINAV